MDIEGIAAIGAIFVGLPWVILHYITKWKTAATLTSGDETLLEELYLLARRLEDRMATVESLVRADHPDFTPARPLAASDLANRDVPTAPLDEIAALRAQKERLRP